MSAKDKRLLNEMETHLQLAVRRKVVYLEDKTDARAFFALLGIAEPPGQQFLHQGVLVQGLGDQTLGRGKSSVRRRVELTEGRRGYEGIVGVVDGDGVPLSQLAATFDAPFSGRLYTWKAYAIENLIAKAGWPPAWGAAPSWGEVLRQYAPYTAFNRLVGELQERLGSLGFGGFMAPILKEALFDGGDIVTALEAQQPQLLKDDLAGRFTILLGEIERLLRSGTDEGHALINGKWLMEDYAPRRQSQLSREDCWTIWIEHVRSSGGLPEVRQFWERVTGNPP